MNKFEFLLLLREKLSVISQEDAERSVDYYSEIIDDRIEDGLAEEEAVAALGNLDDIVTQILADVAMLSKANTNKSNKQSKKFELKPWMIAAIILGSPVWMSLVVGLVAVGGGIIVSIFSVFVSLYATVVAFVGGAVGCVVGACLFEAFAERIFAVGIAMMLVGGAILLLFFSNWLLKNTVDIIKTIYSKTKALISKRRYGSETV